VEFRVLGRLEVVRGDSPVDLGAFRQRALLALLLTAPNTVHSTDRILDELWGAGGGTAKQNALWVYISGLRKALEPDRERRSEGTILLTRAPGYLLQAHPDQIDALRFERMVAEGRSLVDVDPAVASVVLGESLALWRGLAFEDFTYEPFAQAEIARLEELRLEAVELRVEADLARGLARELISELESLVRQHPLREGLTGQLMLALYRSSRQAEALRTYQLLRSRLGEELGIEPSSALRKLEEQIVTGDEALEPRLRQDVTVGFSGPGLGVRGYELRERLDERELGTAYRAYQPAVGREVQVRVIRPSVANDPAFIRRFQFEAPRVAMLDHPQIVPLYDYWREPDAAYLVTPLLRGGTLAGVLDQRPLTTSEATRLVDQIGNALGAAHRSGLVHGDVNADNVLLDDDGQAFLANFGFALPDGEPAPEVDIRGLAVLVAQALTGQRGNVEEVRASLPDHVARVLDRAIGDDSSGRYESVDDLTRDLGRALNDRATDARPLALSRRIVAVSPYKGLRAFDAVDAADFFGRERLVERLVARLGLTGTRGQFVAVVGPSGSGKSSAIKAGLFPAIRNGAVPLSGSWFTITMTPAPHPFEQLEEALLGVAVDPPPSLLEQLAGDHGIQAVVDRVIPDDGSQVLLLIDQFEELFTQVDTATANRFIANVVSAVSDENSRVRVIVTLRADYYDRPLQRRDLGELLRDGTETIAPMTPLELEGAITRPAEQRGVTFEPGLVARLIGDVSDRRGALPLLQYTLTELFEARTGDRIAYADYEAMGGVSGALITRAEGLLRSLGTSAEEVARQVFLRLVTFTDDGEDTRRRVLQSELEDLDIDRAQLRSVLDTFGRHRLLSFDRDAVTRSPTVEISHEALLGEWTRLRDWIDEARNDVRVQRRLADALREWAAAGCTDAYLLRGGLLEEVHGWSAATSLNLAAPERAFLEASVAERDREAQESLERENRASAAERRQKQRSRQLLVVGLAALLVAVAGVFGTVQWRAAVDAKEHVDELLNVNDLVIASRSQLDEHSDLALLLAMQSLRQTVDLGYATEEAVDAVHFALQERGVQYDVDEDTPIAVRPGSHGLPVGVYALTPSELMELAESNVGRALTEAECQRYLAGSCPATADIPADLELRRGMETYAATSSLQGTTVTICLCNNTTLTTGLSRELKMFEERTGIRIEFRGIENEETFAFEPTLRERFPDVYLVPHALQPWAHDRAIDIAQFVDHETLRSDFGDYLLSFGSSAGVGSPPPSDGSVLAIPIRVDPKALVFYPRAVFEDAGYEIPGSWEALVALSDQIVADGRTPWCFGFEHGVASGWPGTDFLESLVLRIGGVGAYDAWTRGEIGFTSPDVAEAGRLANQLIFEPGYVRGGVNTISNQYVFDQVNHLVARDGQTGQAEPDCLMHQAASYVLQAAPATDEVGTDIDFFSLPPIRPDQPTPMIGAAAFMSAFTDRPEVRAFMEFVASPEWGGYWAGERYEHFISPNARFDLSTYGGDVSNDRGSEDQRRSEAEIGVVVRLAEAVRAALQSDAFRFDASDLMPPEIGGLRSDESSGAFWRGMIDWVDRTRTIEQVFADIDAEWAALRAAEESAAEP
jgi:DNA-binding SARP family transcriptional activator/ABC-type glycerol-3-phosphate transport system substrate-binding protein